MAEKDDDIPAQRRDIKLAALVMYVEEADKHRKNDEDRPTSFGVTLLASGGIVSGLLVCERWWQRELVNLMTTAHEKTGSAIRGMLDQIDESVEEGFALAHPDPFVHLQDAYYLLGGNTVVPDGPSVCWRGRLSSISGWSIGNMGRPSDS